MVNGGFRFTTLCHSLHRQDRDAGGSRRICIQEGELLYVGGKIEGLLPVVWLLDIMEKWMGGGREGRREAVEEEKLNRNMEPVSYVCHPDTHLETVTQHAYPAAKSCRRHLCSEEEADG